MAEAPPIVILWRIFMSGVGGVLFWALMIGPAVAQTAIARMDAVALENSLFIAPPPSVVALYYLTQGF